MLSIIKEKEEVISITVVSSVLPGLLNGCLKRKIFLMKKKCFASDMFGLFNEVKHDFSIPMISRELHVLLNQYSNNPIPYCGRKEAKAMIWFWGCMPT